MQVNSDNFELSLPKFAKAVKECDFISFDTEFSGLQRSREYFPLVADTFQERYAKVKDSAESFELLQLGVCTFRIDEHNKVVAKPFNFWIFPDGIRGESQKRFTVQAASFRFLSSCGFDFNQCFSKGIPYLNVDESKHETEKFQQDVERRKENAALDSQRDSKPIPLQQVKEEDMNVINVLLEEIRINAKATLRGDRENESFVVTELFNSFLRRVLYQEVRKEFDTVHICAHAKDNPNKSRLKKLRVTFFDSSEKCAVFSNEQENEKYASDKGKLEAAIGMGRIATILSESKKPLIGHNCYLDLAHFMQKFITALPEDHEVFCELCKLYLPTVVDTKHILVSEANLRAEVRNNALGDAYTTLTNITNVKDMIEIPPGFGYSLSNDINNNYHEAAFDALMTGMVYIGSALHLGETKSIKDALVTLKGYENKLYLMRMKESFDLRGQNVLNRSSWLYASNFPKEWKTRDLQSLFCKYENEDRTQNPQIVWQNDTSACIVFSNDDKAFGAMKAWNMSDKNGTTDEILLNQLTLSFFEDMLLEKQKNKRLADNNSVSMENQPSRKKSTCILM